LIGHVRRRYLQYLANSAVGFRVAHLSGSDVRQPDRHRCPLVRAVRSARRAADRSASIPPVERGNPNRRTASPVSATSDQVVVQSPDSGHSPAGQLHLPPEALRRDRPGQCDQAVRPDRSCDAVVSQTGVAGERGSDRGFDVARLPIRIAPCGGIPHAVLVRAGRHHTLDDRGSLDVMA